MYASFKYIRVLLNVYKFIVITIILYKNYTEFVAYHNISISLIGIQKYVLTIVVLKYSYKMFFFYFRHCLKASLCGRKVVRQSAYCYLEGSYCQLWIRSRMQRRKDPGEIAHRYLANNFYILTCDENYLIINFVQ